MRATSVTRTSEPSGLARTTTLPNSSGVTRRPCARTVYVNCWPGGAGSAPTWPAGLTTFWARTALITSVTVIPSRASTSGFSQTRMA